LALASETTCIQFDLGFIAQLGYEHEGELFDTMLLSQLLYAEAGAPRLRKGRTSHVLGRWPSAS
jgi:hypothetical protein